MSKDEIMDASNTSDKPEPTIEECVDNGQRAYALGQYDEAVKQYGAALELVTAKYGDGAPESADHLLRYGKALIEHAIKESAVLSKEQQDGDGDDEDDVPNDPRFTFGGDTEDEPVHLSELKDEEEEEPEAQEQAEEDGEEEAPEDDFNAAWEVLELARVLYEKQKDEDDEIKLKLADTYLALGDVSTETEKFDQAIEDYTSAITLKTELLPFSSRQIAEGHLKLALVLDITSGRLSDSIRHMELSVESVEARLAELRSGGQTQPAGSKEGEEQDGGKGKGKGKAKKLIRDASITEMTPAEIENEIKDLEGMKQELMNKLDEIRAAPEGDPSTVPGSSGAAGSGGSPKKSTSSTTAPELAARQLERDLALAGGAKFEGAAVQDLTGLVKKKKKAPREDVGATAGASGGVKRKAEDVDESTGKEEKKARVSEELET